MNPNIKFQNVTIDWLKEELRVQLLAKNSTYSKEISSEIKFRNGNDDYNYLNLEEQIKWLIDDEFLEKVSNTFNKMEYKYAILSTDVVEYYTPDINALYDKMVDLLTTTWNSQESLDNYINSTSTGRLYTERVIVNGVKILNIKFIPESTLLDYDMVLRKNQES